MVSSYVKWGDAEVKLTWQANKWLPSDKLVTSAHGFCFYKEKMLLIILKEKDTNFIQESIEEENPSNFAAEIYSFSHRINYIKYWEAKEQEYVQEIAGIRDDVNKIVPLQELKRIRNILSDISDFLADISDWNNTDLATLKKTDYKAFTDEISNFIKI